MSQDSLTRRERVTLAVLAALYLAAVLAVGHGAFTLSDALCATFSP